MPKSEFNTAPCLVDGSKPIRFRDVPTRIEPLCPDKKADKHLQSIREEIDALQQVMYAHDRYAMLCIFQAMDAAGKDGAIRAVFSGVNPHGLEVYAFKTPSPEEIDHTFFWRTDRAMPPRGRIGIFNRSYYEEVLIARVHPDIITRSQKLPEEIASNLETLWAQRFETIRALERNHHRNGTRIHKFYLHLSFEEQRRRFLDRIEDPAKNWKFNEGDVRERQLWPRYIEAYEEAINATATPESPWHVIPADDKKTARLLIATIVRNALKALPISYPVLGEDALGRLAACRQNLMREEG
ncbi:MAG: polyphosphate kinase 2 family protein [Verrucomicrobia bacterium]|nr:polyphosphate kinase 2 family protein [Verrucomicrobiota bacterium]